ncbi:PQQ-dependent sugar dehydrogenase [Halobacillus litoralis]|uniref:PQQ-dependent sugar dehydrogenase n=1 Tax=Halobacillus litoralis TaxID=45668 RepID=UPI001CD5A457|nr:PQQ-dependent sugar dehydrogenase [Halobacillus litoralis]MCA0971172.1 PQQ-dependent sugar dehydrogenase [Halobacillus litoralis]
MKRISWLLFLFFAAGCQSSPEVDGSMEVLADELRSPWDLEIYGEDYFISEREGNVVTVADGQVNRAPLQTSEEIVQIGEGGLLGFHLHPDYETNNLAFAYHTYEDNGLKNRVVLVENQGSEWIEIESVLENIPGARFHNGGRIEMSPDCFLFVTTGDALEENTARDLSSLSGKILRMNMDGRVPSDNPINNSYVYSYGHRNPQGLAWTEEGQLYASEHGPDAHDEINRIDAGADYGWPDYVGDEHDDSVTAPLFHTGTETWAPSGITIYEDQLWIATLRGTALRTLSLEGGNPEVVTEQYGRIRDVVEQEGVLFFITNNTDGRGSPADNDDRLVRYSP